MIYKHISGDGCNLIKSFEGLRLKSYYDDGGILTIGFGHTGKDVYPNQTITEDEANYLFLNDIDKFQKYINNFVKVDITQNMFDALCSICYNIGYSNFATSTLLKKLNSLCYIEAADNFLKWKYIKKQVSAGLLRRRQIERSYFLKNIPQEMNK